MRGTRPRSTVKFVVAILSAACFLTMSLGSVSRAVAADTFETWPKKTTEPGVAVAASAPEANGASTAGDAAGKKAATGLSSGTIGWIAAGTAAVIGIAIAAGGGGSTSNH